MHKISSLIFWITLTLYIITLFNASYVGVYLTYVAIPTILISGLIMKLSKPKNKKTQSEFEKAKSEFFNEVSAGLSHINTSIDKFSRKSTLVEERTRDLRDEKMALRRQRIEPDIELKYAKTSADRNKYTAVIKEIDRQIAKIDDQINEIKKQCELEIERDYL